MGDLLPTSELTNSQSLTGIDRSQPVAPPKPKKEELKPAAPSQSPIDLTLDAYGTMVPANWHGLLEADISPDKRSTQETLTRIYGGSLQASYLTGRRAMVQLQADSGVQDVFVSMKDQRWKALFTLFQKTQKDFAGDFIDGSNVDARLKKYLDTRTDELRKIKKLPPDITALLAKYDGLKQGHKEAKEYFTLGIELLALDTKADDLNTIKEAFELIHPRPGKKYGRLAFSIQPFEGIYLKKQVNMGVAKADGGKIAFNGSWVLGEKVAKDEPFIKFLGGLLSRKGLIENDSLARVSKYLGSVKGGTIDKTFLDELVLSLSAAPADSSKPSLKLYVTEKINQQTGQRETHYSIARGEQVLMADDNMPERMEPEFVALAENLQKAGAKGKNIFQLIIDYYNVKAEDEPGQETADEAQGHSLKFNTLLSNLLGNGVKDNEAIIAFSRELLEEFKTDTPRMRADILKLFTLVVYFQTKPGDKVNLANLKEAIATARGYILNDTINHEKIELYYSILERKGNHEAVSSGDEETWATLAKYTGFFKDDLSRKNKAGKTVSRETLFGALSVAEVGVQGTKKTEEAATIKRQLDLATNELALQAALEKKYEAKPNALDINEKFMAGVAIKAQKKGLHEVSLESVIKSLPGMAGTRADAFQVVLSYIKVISAKGALALPNGFLGALELFARGQRPLKLEEMQYFLKLIEGFKAHGFEKKAFQQAVAEARGQATLPVWGAFLTGEKGIKVQTDAGNSSFVALPSIDAKGTGIVAEKTSGLVAENIAVKIEDLPKEAPLANLWLLAVSQYFSEMPAGEMAQARLHGPLNQLSAANIRTLVKVFDEKKLITQPLNQSAQRTLREVLDAAEGKRKGGDKIKLPPGFKFSKEEKELARKVLAYSENPGKVQMGVLSAAELALMPNIGRGLAYVRDGLDNKDPKKKKVTALIDGIRLMLETLTPITKTFEQKEALQKLAGLMEQVKFKTKNGQVIDRVYSLANIPELDSPEAQEVYQKGIRALTDIADGLREGSVYDDERTGVYHNWVVKGFKESMQVEDAAMLNGVEEGTVQFYKYMFFYGPKTYTAQITGWSNTLKGKLAELDTHNHGLEDLNPSNPADFKKLQQEHDAMKKLVADIRAIKQEISLFLSAQKETLDQLQNMGVKAACLTLIAKAVQAETGLLETEKIIAFQEFIDKKLGASKKDKGKREEFVRNCVDPDPKTDKAKKVRKGYLEEFINKFELKFDPLDKELDSRSAEASKLEGYLNSEEIDERFMAAFIRTFGGDHDRDFGAFEINFDAVPKLTKSNMTLKDEAGNDIKTGRGLHDFILRTFRNDKQQWLSLSKDPTDNFLTTRRAKQAFALVLSSMPVKKVTYDVVRTGLNIAGSLGERKAQTLGSRLLGRVFNPLTFGALNYAEGLAAEALGWRQELGGADLEGLRTLVNDPAARRNYQLAQAAGPIATPLSGQTRNISVNARLLFDQSLGANSETELSSIGHKTVEGALRMLDELRAAAADRTLPDHQVKYNELLEQDKITINVIDREEYDKIKQALAALARHLKENDLQVELLGGQLGAAPDADAIPALKDAPTMVKLGMVYLSQLATDAPLIMNKVMRDKNEETGGLGAAIFNPKQVMSDRLTIKIEHTAITGAEKVTISRNTAGGAPFSVEYASGSREPLDIVRDKPTFNFSEVGKEGMLEGASFAYKIPVDIFSGFVNDVVELAKLLEEKELKARYYDSKGDQAKASLCREKAKLLGKGLKENLRSTYSSFLAFETNPTTMLVAWWQMLKHKQYDKALGYALIVFPYALTTFGTDAKIVRNFLRWAAGDSALVGGLRWNEYGLATSPVAMAQKALLWFDRTKPGSYFMKGRKWLIGDKARLSPALDFVEGKVQGAHQAARFSPLVRAARLPSNILGLRGGIRSFIRDPRARDLRVATQGGTFTADVTYLFKYYSTRSALGKHFVSAYRAALAAQGLGPQEVEAVISTDTQSGLIKSFNSREAMISYFLEFEEYAQDRVNQVVAQEVVTNRVYYEHKWNTTLDIDASGALNTNLTPEQMLDASKRADPAIKGLSRTLQSEYADSVRARNTQMAEALAQTYRTSGTAAAAQTGAQATAGAVPPPPTPPVPPQGTARTTQLGGTVFLDPEFLKGFAKGSVKGAPQMVLLSSAISIARAALSKDQKVLSARTAKEIGIGTGIGTAFSGIDSGLRAIGVGRLKSLGIAGALIGVGVDTYGQWDRIKSGNGWKILRATGNIGLSAANGAASAVVFGAVVGESGGVMLVPAFAASSGTYYVLDSVETAVLEKAGITQAFDDKELAANFHALGFSLAIGGQGSDNDKVYMRKYATTAGSVTEVSSMLKGPKTKQIFDRLGIGTFEIDSTADLNRSTLLGLASLAEQFRNKGAQYAEGKLTVKMSPVNVHRFAEGKAATWQVTVTNGSQTLKARLPMFLEGDPLKVQQRMFIQDNRQSVSLLDMMSLNVGIKFSDLGKYDTLKQSLEIILGNYGGGTLTEKLQRFAAKQTSAWTNVFGQGEARTGENNGYLSPALAHALLSSYPSFDQKKILGKLEQIKKATGQATVGSAPAVVSEELSQLAERLDYIHAHHGPVGINPDPTRFDPQVYTVQVALQTIGLLGRDKVTGFFGLETVNALKSLNTNFKQIDRNTIHALSAKLEAPAPSSPATKTVEFKAPSPAAAQPTMSADNGSGRRAHSSISSTDAVIKMAGAEIKGIETRNPADYYGGVMSELGIEMFQVARHIPGQPQCIEYIKKGLAAILENEKQDHKTYDQAFVVDSGKTPESENVYKIRLVNTNTGKEVIWYLQAFNGGFGLLKSSDGYRIKYLPDALFKMTNF